MILDKQAIARHFSRSAGSYQAAAVLQQRVAAEMIERLDLVNIEPRVILDLGCGPVFKARQLGKRFNKAMVLGMDLSPAALRQSRPRRRLFQRFHLLCADAEAVPLQENSIDLVFSNLMLPWCDPRTVFEQCWRILKPGALLVFSSYGPDTLRELRTAWQDVDDSPHVHPFIDMHDLGDCLGQCGFTQTVMDCERYTLTYTDVRAVLRDLQDTGAVNANIRRRKSLTGRKRFQRFVKSYENQCHGNGQIAATCEAVFAHTWVPLAKSRVGEEISSLAVTLK
jgi:malonyl-CoA O-methyltransferase